MLKLIAMFVLLALAPAYAGARYALIRPDNTIDRLATDVLPNVQTKPGWKWLPAPPATPPAYDPATQVLSGPTLSVGSSQVTESYSIRAKTAGELDADKDARAADMSDVAFRVICNHENRIRALTPSPPPQLTLTQCRAALKALLP